MAIDTDLFAPIIFGDAEKKLRELVRQIMTSPANDKMTTQVANQIVDIFGKRGITDEHEIVDAVHRIIKDLNGHLVTSPSFLFAVANMLAQAVQRRAIYQMIDVLTVASLVEAQ